MVVAGIALGCDIVNPDFDRVIALEVVSVDLTVQVGDSVQLVARAVNAAGEVVTSAVVVWSIIDFDSGQISFALDTTTGVVTGQQAGSGRVQARVEDIRSNPILVTVVPDSAGTSVMRRSTPHPALYSHSLQSYSNQIRVGGVRGVLQVRTCAPAANEIT